MSDFIEKKKLDDSKKKMKKANNLPKLTESERVALSEFLEMPEFYKNRTKYFKNEIIRYIKQKRVFRISIMGETRSGKSEIGSTICFWYVNIFNQLFNKKKMAKMDVFNDNFGFKPKKIEFNTDYVCSNQQEYKDKMKNKYSDRSLNWGQIWQIDEEKESTGGVGSMSEQIELTNLNNIIAKFNQAEIWIQPLKLETRNAPYGLQVVHNDYENKVNWCLLFKVKHGGDGLVNFSLVGWVKIPLHNNEDFRKDYNMIKNDWISSELEGGGDKRSQIRTETAETIAEKYPKLFELSESGKSFKYSKKKRLIFLQRLIKKNIIKTPFNSLELDYILEEAEMIVSQDEILSELENE